ncbi:DUF6531 domain-containing protein [Aquimarina sp. MMG016]|uniref:DUF6531 domain-containing protein n=1 Tax=Aquimarina sp. MMG016 TaxID=2822690 RepID=UPI001B39ECBE|nr:DUF6531 domain-containing protein [Aquimarina sp. MMG016]MBQ4820629.1 RHS domain-containing protein [Aquimarina sp. MMG016]
MPRHKCIPSKTHLECSAGPKGVTCPLIIEDLKVNIKSQPLGLETDKKFAGFGTCMTTGQTCKPNVESWKNLSDPKVRSNKKKLLTGHSKLFCTSGAGVISIKIKPPTPPTPDEDTFFGSIENGLNNMESTLKAPARSLAKSVGNSWFGKKALGLFKGASEMAGDAQDAILKKGAEWGVENGFQFGIDVANNLVYQANHYGAKAVNFVIDSVDESASNLYDQTQEVVAYGERIETSDDRIGTVLEIGQEIGNENLQQINNNIEHFGQEIEKFNQDRVGYVIDPLKQEYYDVRLGLTDGIETFNDTSLSQEERTTGMIDGAAPAVVYAVDKVNIGKAAVMRAKGLADAVKNKGGGSVNVSSNITDTSSRNNENDRNNTQNKENQDSDGTSQQQGDESDSQKPNEATGQASDTTDQEKGDPVDVVTGTVINNYVDFEIPGIIPIQWKRNWYSDSKYKGPLGYGCHHSYDIQLKQRTHDLFMTLPDGRAAFFKILTTENATTYNRVEKLTLTLLENKNYELFDHKKQLTYILEYRSDVYRVTKLCNTNGIAVHFQYINSRLHRIIDTAGRIIKIHSDKNDRITKITLHNKLKEKTLVSYDYNDAGDMITMTDPLGQSTRAVYKNHLMIAKTDRNGQIYYWEYDGFKTGAKCIHTWGDGGVLDYTITYGKEYNTVTNSLGHTSLFYHQGGNLTTKIVDPLGGEIIKEYDEDQKLIKFIDEEGVAISYDYDEFGNLITTTYPDSVSTNYAYDNKGRLQLLTRPEGGNLIKSYKNDRLDCVISPDGMMTTFDYNEKGLISKVYDNQDNETLLYYDEDHNLSKIILPNGAISLWEYDEWGQCISVINPEKHKQQFHYDILGRVTNVQLPDNNKIQLKYNGYEQVVEAIDKHRTVKFEYTRVGSLKTREENGKKIYFRYDNEDQLLGVINRKGESYNFTRDPKGNIIREQGYDDITRHFQRDKAGKVYKVDRPDDKHSIYEYNKGGRISRIEHHDGTWATYNYNKDGLLVEAINPNSHVQLKRDEAGRIVSENQGGHIVTSEYGELGIRTGIISSLGADINFEHSAIGEGTSTIAKVGQNKPWEANYKYNSLGMETERVLTGGITNSWSYDRAGRPLQQKVRSQGGEQRNRSYNWDVNNKLKKITDNLTRGIVQFSYDDFNNLASAQYEDGSYDYKLPDEVGNLYRTKGKNDKEYGKSGRLLRSGATTYKYDNEGNLIKKDSPEGIWEYIWEAGGMLQSVTKPDKTNISFEYDALGRRTAKIVQSNNGFSPSQGEMSEGQKGSITRFIWDGNVPLHEWQYELKNRPKTIVDSSGNISKDKKEPIQDLTTWVFDQGTFKPAAKITKEDTYSIIMDYLGTPIEMYDSSGEKIWQAIYDIYGKVRNLVIGSLNDCPFRYQGQYEDQETGLYYNRFRYYNAEDGVYISQDPIRLKGNNPNIYAYTHDSNTWVDVFGLSEGQEAIPLNEREHHGYVVYDKETGEILEYGISGQVRTPNEIARGESPRITQKLKQKYENDPIVGGQVIEDSIPDRPSAFKWEQDKVNTHANPTGEGPPMQILPKPNNNGG